MNRERIEELAAAIEQAPMGPCLSRFKDIVHTRALIQMPTEFQMDNFLVTDEGHCNTVGCIGGFCLGLFSPNEEPPKDEEAKAHLQITRGILAKVAEQLDIDFRLACALCTPHTIEDSGWYDQVKPEDAAEAVRGLLRERDLSNLTDLQLDKELWGDFIDHMERFEEGCDEEEDEDEERGVYV